MMRVIEAEERMAAMNDRAAAAGNMDPRDRRRLVRRLERASRGDEEPRPARATPAVLASMGIGVVNPSPMPPEGALSPSSGSGEADV